jgi:undecaprenyl-diphosphatase
MKLSFDKKFVYDWVGANGWLFKEINALDGNPTYNSLMIFLSSLADHSNFPYFAVAIISYAVLDFLFRKLIKKGGAKHSLIAWIGLLCVFGVSYLVDGEIIRMLKEYFSYPRPYVAYGPQDVHVLGTIKEGDGYHGFPSGHAAFITVLVGSLWPILDGKGPQIVLALVFAVCWSRIAMGMHFPADVIGGALIAFAVVLVVRFFIYSLFAKLFKWKC